MSQLWENVRAAPLQVPWHCPSGSFAAPLEVLGDKLWDQIFNFRSFLAPSTITSFSTPHYYPKYEVWAIEIFCGRIPLSFRRRYIQDLIVTDPIYIRFLYPMSSISLSASIFMTVSVTVERYWAVCKPAVGYYSKR